MLQKEQRDFSEESSLLSPVESRANWQPGKPIATKSLSPPIPAYLKRYYDWAYLWPVSTWFFDFQPIINLILFGQYRRIMQNALELMEKAGSGRTIQIANVYGHLTPTLAERIKDLHLIDVAPIQLQLTERKLAKAGRETKMALMDAEQLLFENDHFDTSLLFFLLHELPAEARKNCLKEAIRVTRPGGTLVIAEYGEFGKRHFLHNNPVTRWVLTHAEPFLGEFWRENLHQQLKTQASEVNKSATVVEEISLFNGFTVCSRSISISQSACCEV